MEDIKYEGSVCISSAEYRELVTKAVEAELRCDAMRSEKWGLETENRKLKTELAEAKKEIDSHRNQLAAFYVNAATRSDCKVRTTDISKYNNNEEV